MQNKLLSIQTIWTFLWSVGVVVITTGTSSAVEWANFRDYFSQNPEEKFNNVKAVENKIIYGVSQLPENTAVTQVETAGIKARIAGGENLARLFLEPIRRFEVRIDVHPAGHLGLIPVQVELAKTGRTAWPAEELCVVDETGKAVPIRRNGIQWHQFDMTVPGVRRSYLVRAVPPDDTKPGRKLPTESERIASDSATGIFASICKWYGGRDAALSIRFDDSHPTHLSQAIPILREFGIRTTFMINPGNPDFQEHREEWEVCARTGEHEFANHTLHHRGAATEEGIECELGEVSKYIWTLFPQRSKLVALNRGGGTVWVTKKPFSHYLRKYHLFHVSGSLGMDDVYGNRIAAFERHLVSHIQRGGWCKTHFHSIGQGLATSEENFIAEMRLVKKYEPQLWLAGLADIYKYQAERKAAKLALIALSPDCVEVQLSCGTDPGLYDQRLTIQVELPHDWSPARIRVMHEDEEPVIFRVVSGPERNLIRWHVPPVNSRYVLRREQ